MKNPTVDSIEAPERLRKPRVLPTRWNAHENYWEPLPIPAIFPGRKHRRRFARVVRRRRPLPVWFTPGLTIRPWLLKTAGPPPQPSRPRLFRR